LIRIRRDPVRPLVRPIVAFSLLIILCVAGCRNARVRELEPAPPPHVKPLRPQERSVQGLLESLGVRYHPAERSLEVSGWVNLNDAPVEVFACAPGGKTHEAVVVLDCVPSGLHAGLLALGLKPRTPTGAGLDRKRAPFSGDRVLVQVRWTGRDGRERNTRAEDWVWNAGRGRAMERVGWVFTGSLTYQVPGKEDERLYAADHVKSLVTTFHDATAVLETPLPEASDDTAYRANPSVVPARGTSITVIFSPAGSGEP